MLGKQVSLAEPLGTWGRVFTHTGSGNQGDCEGKEQCSGRPGRRALECLPYPP